MLLSTFKNNLLEFKELFLKYQNYNTIYFEYKKIGLSKTLYPQKVLFQKNYLASLIRVLVLLYNPQLFQNPTFNKYEFIRQIISLTCIKGSYKYINSLMNSTQCVLEKNAVCVTLTLGDESQVPLLIPNYQKKGNLSIEQKKPTINSPINSPSVTLFLDLVWKNKKYFLFFPLTVISFVFLKERGSHHLYKPAFPLVQIDKNASLPFADILSRSSVPLVRKEGFRSTILPFAALSASTKTALLKSKLKPLSVFSSKTEQRGLQTNLLDNYQRATVVSKVTQRPLENLEVTAVLYDSRMSNITSVETPSVFERKTNTYLCCSSKQKRALIKIPTTQHVTVDIEQGRVKLELLGPNDTLTKYLHGLNSDLTNRDVVNPQNEANLKRSFILFDINETFQNQKFILASHKSNTSQSSAEQKHIQELQAEAVHAMINYPSFKDELAGTVFGKSIGKVNFQS